MTEARGGIPTGMGEAKAMAEERWAYVKDA
jgi:hypothetical protein